MKLRSMSATVTEEPSITLRLVNGEDITLENATIWRFQELYEDFMKRSKLQSSDPDKVQ